MIFVEETVLPIANPGLPEVGIGKLCRIWAHVGLGSPSWFRLSNSVVVTGPPESLLYPPTTRSSFSDFNGVLVVGDLGDDVKRGNSCGGDDMVVVGGVLVNVMLAISLSPETFQKLINAELSF